VSGFSISNLGLGSFASIALKQAGKMYTQAADIAHTKTTSEAKSVSLVRSIRDEYIPSALVSVKNTYSLLNKGQHCGVAKADKVVEAEMIDTEVAVAETEIVDAKGESSSAPAFLSKFYTHQDILKDISFVEEKYDNYKIDPATGRPIFSRLVAMRDGVKLTEAEQKELFKAMADLEKARNEWRAIAHNVDAIDADELLKNGGTIVLNGPTGELHLAKQTEQQGVTITDLEGNVIKPNETLTRDDTYNPLENFLSQTSEIEYPKTN
jgi:hypothetical protein